MLNRRIFIATSTFPLWSCKTKTEVEGEFVGPSIARGHGIKHLQNSNLLNITTKSINYLIIGAGVSGLSASRALQQKDVDDFAILELEDQVGGNSKAAEINGIACPLGAHYLPVPTDAAYEVQDFLEEIAIRKRVAGRWVIDEKHLCHSPQERLFIHGQWQEGVLPINGISKNTLQQYYKFKEIIDNEIKKSKWLIPVRESYINQTKLRYFASISFSNFLKEKAIDDVYLLWYLSYCCLDEYGADINSVSAWAGIHYFASRHGFNMPDEDNKTTDGLLTWPEGNAWLINRLESPVKSHIYTGQVVFKIEQNKHDVKVYVFNNKNKNVECWIAKKVIVAIPIFVANKLVQNPKPILKKLSNEMNYAPWLVANIHINTHLNDNMGAARSWDNVIYGSKSLGYVDASHQNLYQKRNDTVITHYRALGHTNTPSVQRQWLLEQPWNYWRDAIFSEFSECHPDLSEKTMRIDISRYGHAMAIPAPNSAGRVGYSLNERTDGRIIYAHSDWAGYSIFEEAFTLGYEAGRVL